MFIYKRFWRHCRHHFHDLLADLIIRGEQLLLVGMIGALTMSGMLVSSILNMFISIGPLGLGMNDWIVTPILLSLAGILSTLAFGRLRRLLGYKPFASGRFGFSYQRGPIRLDTRLEGIIWLMNALGAVVVALGLFMIIFTLSELV